jgi:hypothetical protein
MAKSYTTIPELETFRRGVSLLTQIVVFLLRLDAFMLSSKKYANINHLFYDTTKFINKGGLAGVEKERSTVTCVIKISSIIVYVYIMG